MLLFFTDLANYKVDTNMGNILAVIERDFYTISKDEEPPYNEHWISLATVKIKWH